jgi:putative transposase
LLWVLNLKTLFDCYPLPRIRSCLNDLAKFFYFFSADLFAGFHQVPMTENARSKTGIVTQFGTYEFLGMNFGLKNAAQHQQRNMDMVFQDFTFEDWMCIFIDDILGFSMTKEEHWVHIERFLERCAQYQLKLNANKVAFFSHIY